MLFWSNRSSRAAGLGERVISDEIADRIRPRKQREAHHDIVDVPKVPETSENADKFLEHVD